MSTATRPLSSVLGVDKVSIELTFRKTKAIPPLDGALMPLKII